MRSDPRRTQGHTNGLVITTLSFVYPGEPLLPHVAACPVSVASGGGLVLDAVIVNRSHSLVCSVWNRAID